MPKLDYNIYGLDELSFANSVSAKALGKQDVINAEGGDVSEKEAIGGRKTADDPIDSAPTFVIKHETDMGKGRASAEGTKGNHGAQG